MGSKLSDRFLSSILNVAVSSSLVVCLINNMNPEDATAILILKVLLSASIGAWSWFIVKSLYDHIRGLEDGKNSN